MEKVAEYILSAYSFIKEYPLEKLLDIGYQSKEGDPIRSFEEKDLIQLCHKARSFFEKEDNVLEINDDLIIIGDIHGSFLDLLRFLKYVQENDNKVLFLGDYVDRGDFSLECITILFSFKVLYPNNFFLLRGNHEFDTMCNQYGFKDEIINYHKPGKIKDPSDQQKNLEKSQTNSLSFKFDDFDKKSKLTFDDKYDEYYTNYSNMNRYKYSDKLYDSFIKAFSYLPIGAVVNHTTFCIHGGLSPRLEYLYSLQKDIIRPIVYFEDNRLFTDLLWSDPSNSHTCLFGENPRGRGYLFNSDSVKKFLLDNSLNRIIRAHECVKHGTKKYFNEKCITVFSASSYSQDMGNKSGILKLFESDDRIEFISFSPLSRLQKADTVYYKVESFNNEDKIHHYFSIRHPILHRSPSTRTISTKNCKQINTIQSLHHIPSQYRINPAFVTSSRRSHPCIKKPMSHSTSLNDFDNLPKKKIIETQSLLLINDMPGLSDSTQ